MNFQMFKLDLEKEEPEIKCQHLLHHRKSKEFQRNICFIDYAKAFDYVDHNKLWSILQEMGMPDHLSCLLRNLYAGQQATVRTGHGTTDLVPHQERSTSCCISSSCLFNICKVSTSFKMPGWMKHKLELRLLGET